MYNFRRILSLTGVTLGRASLLVSLIPLLSTASLAATTYYATPSTPSCPCRYPTLNTDVGCGTSGNPFSCIADGVKKAADGDTVTVLAGTYNECVNIRDRNNLTVQAQGE